MALLNHAKKELSAKIVYYGPGLSGKTTNLEWIHKKWDPQNRGKLISLETKTDRTLFFDFLPVQIGEISGYKTRFNVYTVPGQIFYNETRKMVLKGVDGVVFVADTQKEMSSENLENLKNLSENLRTIGKDFTQIPLVLQYNKRDLPNTLTIEELNELLNPNNVPYFEAIAVQGEGVLTTLARISRMVADNLKGTLFGAQQNQVPAPPEPPPAPEPTPQLELDPPPPAPVFETAPDADVPMFMEQPQGQTAAAPTPPPAASYTEIIETPELVDMSGAMPPEFPQPAAGPQSPAVHEMTAHLQSDTPSLVGFEGTSLAESVPPPEAPSAVSPVTMMPTPSVPESLDTAFVSSPESLGDLALSPPPPQAETIPANDNWMDPSMVPISPQTPAPATPLPQAAPAAPGISVRLGTPAAGTGNEVKIPITLALGESDEGLSLEVVIRIDTK